MKTIKLLAIITSFGVVFSVLGLNSASAREVAREEERSPRTENPYEARGQALSNAAHNATTSQQQSNVTDQAATTQGVATLYGVDTASTGEATEKIFE